MTIATTAAEAFRLYEQALSADALIQGKWHREVDGRQLACALGVLGPDVNNPKDCPAQIMPHWLARMVPLFFDNQKLGDAKDWGRRFYAEIARLDGQVPFEVVHDWHANVVAPMAIEVATKHGRATAPHEAKRELHLRALRGDLAPKAEWVAVLRSAYADAVADAYVYAYVYPDADAYVEADAYADADAYVEADAYADAVAVAAAIKRLADGMIDCLSRVPTPEQKGD